MQMHNLCLPLLSFLLTACALFDPSASPPITPTPRAVNDAIVDLYITILDSDSNEPVVADTVWIDDEIAHRKVSACILMLSADYPAGQDGYEIRIKTQGYDLWTTRVRPRARQSHSLVLPVHLHRVKPQT